jgi:hypothetical protein
MNVTGPRGFKQGEFSYDSGKCRPIHTRAARMCRSGRTHCPELCSVMGVPIGGVFLSAMFLSLLTRAIEGLYWEQI